MNTIIENDKWSPAIILKSMIIEILLSISNITKFFLAIIKIILIYNFLLLYSLFVNLLYINYISILIKYIYILLLMN